MSIGERIRQRREELGMSQSELARKAGYKSRSSINKIESDDRGATREQLEHIARALRVTPSYLMGWEDNIYEDNGLPRLLAELTFIQEESVEHFFELNATNQQIVHDLIENLLNMQKGSDVK